MKEEHNIKAYTLLELVIALCIVIFMSGIGLIIGHRIGVNLTATGQIEALRHAINYTRSLAIYRHQEAQLSPLGTWQQGYETTVGGQLIKRFHASSHAGTIIWRNFPGYDYLAFDAQGYSINQNGTFSYYDTSGQLIAKLIISQSGRVRVE